MKILLESADIVKVCCPHCTYAEGSWNWTRYQACNLCKVFTNYEIELDLENLLRIWMERGYNNLFYVAQDIEEDINWIVCKRCCGTTKYFKSFVGLNFDYGYKHKSRNLHKALREHYLQKIVK